MNLELPVSLGEAIDKLTILHIKFAISSMICYPKDDKLLIASTKLKQQTYI